MWLSLELEDVKNRRTMFDIVKDVVCIAGSAVKFIGEPTELFLCYSKSS